MLEKGVALAVLGLASTVAGRHSHHDNSHSALMNLLGTAVLEPSTLVSSPDTKCNKTCTPSWGGRFTDEFDACSGVYEKVCHSTDAKHLYTRVVCEGLWYDNTRSGNDTDASKTHDTPAFSSCEGGFSFFAKGVHGADTDAVVDSSSPGAIIAAESGEPAQPAAYAVGYGCLGKQVGTKTDENGIYMSCDQLSGFFMAGKALPAGKDLPASETAALAEAEDISNDQLRDFFRGSAPGAQPDRPDRPDHHHEHHHGHHDHDDDHHDHDHQHSCKVTCNGNPLKLWGLFPCWGKLEAACSNERGSITATCKGSTWPILGSCKGLYSVAASGKKGTMYGVNAGKHKVGPLHSHHDGWKGWYEMSEGRASNFVQRADADAQAGAGLAGLEHLSDLSPERLASMNPAGLLRSLESA